MGILNIFKRKKPADSSAVRRAEPRPIATKPRKLSKIAFRVLQGPQVTEKATDLVKNNQYVFRVFRHAGKPEIKRAVEDVYGVDVVSIKIVNIPKKARKLGRIEGWRKSYKKAVVKIKGDQKIEVLPR